MRKKRCRYCREWYQPHRQTHRREKACKKPSCRRQRRCQALRAWRSKNPNYDDNRGADHREWRKKHRGYWRAYRAAHPVYEKRNRVLQRQRDGKRRNLANRNDWNSLHREKLTRIRVLDMLANRNDCRMERKRVTEEICRYLDWSWLLAKRNDSDRR